MKSWSTITESKEELLKKWERGDFYKTVEFPFSYTIKSRPKNKDISDHFDQVLQWNQKIIKEAEKYDFLKIEFKSLNNRIHGTQDLVYALVFISIAELAKFLNKTKELKSFIQSKEALLAQYPQLENWSEKYPLKILQHKDSWNHFFKVIKYFQRNPQPNCYIRQLEIDAVHTKFIEKNKGLLIELFERLLPSECINERFPAKSSTFEKRYGLKEKEGQIRFRILDKSLKIYGLDDLQIPVSQFKNLHLDIECVFIAENEINGLSFPTHPGSIIIFGLGYAVDLLREIDWLKEKKLYYWGDIDIHGFYILNRFKKYFPKAQSFLMNQTIWAKHSQFQVSEENPSYFAPEYLSSEEYKLFQTLFTLSEQGKSSRLEQEKIEFKYVREALEKLP